MMTSLAPSAGYGQGLLGTVLYYAGRIEEGIGRLRLAITLDPHRVTARMHGRIRSGPDARWIGLNAEQTNSFAERSRLFYFNGSMNLLPVQEQVVP